MNQILLRIDQRSVQIEYQCSHRSQLRVSHEPLIAVLLSLETPHSPHFLMHYEFGVKENILSFFRFSLTSRKIEDLSHRKKHLRRPHGSGSSLPGVSLQSPARLVRTSPHPALRQDFSLDAGRLLRGRSA